MRPVSGVSLNHKILNPPFFKEQNLTLPTLNSQRSRNPQNLSKYLRRLSMACDNQKNGDNKVKAFQSLRLFSRDLLLPACGRSSRSY
ncbi:hypothetical protein EYC80_003012 [Monilinia laxa]|uniref:Uncharacterized protein n=1 Tax=Monilinia laxa TaxID=61186 RepID=A0A5N6KCD4_MONLA|nr:hypothetical protein EYC80_003012 [Monilinia laxa]